MEPGPTHTRALRVVGSGWITTYSGKVTAASDWGGMHEPNECVLPSPAVVKRSFINRRRPRFFVTFAELQTLVKLGGKFLIFSRIADQLDAILHFDETSAVEPLAPVEKKQTPEVPETYPVGV